MFPHPAKCQTPNEYKYINTAVHISLSNVMEYKSLTIEEYCRFALWLIDPSHIAMCAIRQQNKTIRKYSQHKWWLVHRVIYYSTQQHQTKQPNIVDCYFPRFITNHNYYHCIRKITESSSRSPRRIPCAGLKGTFLEKDGLVQLYDQFSAFQPTIALSCKSRPGGARAPCSPDIFSPPSRCPARPSGKPQGKANAIVDLHALLGY